KSRVHHFVRGVLTDQELHDALLLAAAATIVLPLLPDRAIDPWQVLNLRKLWLLAVIIMAINAAGHIALRVFGARTGLLLAGLAGGFASSTATIASMGARARRNPELAMACAGAGVVSNVSTVAQLGVVAGALSPPLLARLWVPLLAAGGVIVLFALVAAWASRKTKGGNAVVAGRAFEPKHVLLFVAMMASMMMLSAAMLAWLGDTALDATLAVSGLADVHAAAASAAQLVAVGRIGAEVALRAGVRAGRLAVALMVARRREAQPAIALRTAATNSGSGLVPICSVRASTRPSASSSTSALVWLNSPSASSR
ncbi:MAG: DUF4010 domain-containing protein, partial [Lysobacteraceae bacterium]